MFDCEFVIVRHGQTEANDSGVLQGQVNSPLDALGRLQVRALAERLCDEPFDAVYSSDLGRAVDTAKAILELHEAVPFHLTPELREWSLGDLEGKDFSLLYREYPQIMDAFRKETPEIHIPGGESKTQFSHRISEFLDRTADANPNKRILMVSHGGVLQTIFRKVVGPTADGNLLSLSGNASLNVFRRKKTGWQLTTWNDVSHLRNVGVNDLFTF